MEIVAVVWKASWFQSSKHRAGDWVEAEGLGTTRIALLLPNCAMARSYVQTLSLDIWCIVVRDNLFKDTWVTLGNY